MKTAAGLFSSFLLLVLAVPGHCVNVAFETDLIDGRLLPVTTKKQPANHVRSKRADNNEEATTTTAQPQLSALLTPTNAVGLDSAQSENICYPSRHVGPIVLCSDEAEFDANFTQHPFRFENFYRQILGMLTQNTPNSRTWVPLATDWSDLPMVDGGHLGGLYVLHEVQIHYGGSACEGSFHAIDLQVSPVEVHLIFFNVKFNSFDKAKTRENGLLILAILFDFFDEESLKDAEAVLRREVNSSKAHTPEWDYLSMWPIGKLPVPLAIGNLGLASSGGEQLVRRHFRYQGSLTAPPCYVNSVMWIVAEQRLPMSRNYYETLVSERTPPRFNNIDRIRQLRRSLNSRPVLFASWQNNE